MLKLVDDLSGDISHRTAELLGIEEKREEYQPNERDENIMNKFLDLKHFEEKNQLSKSFVPTFGPLAKYIRILKKKVEIAKPKDKK